MKTFKKVLILFSVVVMLVCCAVFASAASDVTLLGVVADIDGAAVQINHWENEGKLYLFLPSDADTSALTLKLEAAGAVTMDGTAVADGDTLSLAAGTHTVTVAGNAYTLYVLQSANVASVHITTESGSMDYVHADKSNKEAADIIIIDDGEVVIEKELDYIKGRGNSTWKYVKKPYNIKFDKKTDLFGMGKAKKWSLLANYNDESVLRNHIALNLAQDAGIAYTSNHVYVDLYINNEYYGNYTLTESVEVGENRVDINDLEKATEEVNTEELDSYSLGGAQVSDYQSLKGGTQKWVNIPNNPENITGGYLLECEIPSRYVNEVSGFISKRNQPIVVKSPEYASQAQVKYISALYQEFEDALFSETGYNSLGKHYTEYIDVESFVKMCVFQDYVKNLDVGQTSFYIYKDADSDIFVAAPVWDFDYALGNNYQLNDGDLKDPEGWWVGIRFYRTANDSKYQPIILAQLFKHDDFFAQTVDAWQDVFAPILTDDYIAGIKAFSQEITDSAVSNAIRWNIFETSTYEATANKYTSYVDSDVIKFMKVRRSEFNRGYSDTGVRIFFDANGGTGQTFTTTIAQVGDKLTLPKNAFTNGALVFDGWNTAKDGSGTSYANGETITLESTRITLYAQWRELEVLNFFAKIMEFFNNIFEKIRSFFTSIFG